MPDFPAEGTPAFINRGLSPAEWAAYVAGYDFGPVAPSRVVLHHTYIPKEADWRGLPTMRGMQRYYRDLGWRAGPHVFAGPDRIWLATPMKDIGIHAGTGNSGTVGGKLWYSIGLEMVGYFDRERPKGPVWEHAKAVMGGLSRRLGIAPRQLISFHRDYTNQKSCPGWAVTHEWVWTEVERWLRPAVPTERLPVTPIAPDIPLLGACMGTQEQAVRYILARPHGEYTERDVRLIVNAYWTICARLGVDALLLVAQLIHETNCLAAWWAARPRRNPAGIGVTGRFLVSKPAVSSWAQKDGLWFEGCSFADWAKESIPAHIGRVLAYALRDDQATPEQQSLINYALRVRPLAQELRGSARTLEQLGAAHNPVNTGQPRDKWSGWAVPGDNYGTAIAAIATAILRMA